MSISRRTVLKSALASSLIPAATSAAWAQNKTPFRIGIITDQSSVYSTVSGKGSVAALQMAVEDFGGQVLGRPIEVLSADHQNKAEIATGIAREWFDTKGVEAVFDLAQSACAMAVMGVATNMNKIVVVSSGVSSDITGKACSPVAFHWCYDTYSQASVQPQVHVKRDKKRWFLLNSDYAFGVALERDVAKSVEGSGGKVIGRVRAPLGTSDFSAALLAASNAQPEVIQIGLSGTDLNNMMKQAREFGLHEQMVFATTQMTMIDCQSLGLQVAQGLFANEPWYWDESDQSRAWSKRYIEKIKAPPITIQAGNYSSVLHYLKAVTAVGGANATEVAKAMRGTPINDMMSKNLRIREDGRVIRGMNLYRVKTPAESKYQYDNFEFIEAVEGDKVVRPLSESECPLIKK